MKKYLFILTIAIILLFTACGKSEASYTEKSPESKKEKITEIKSVEVTDASGETVTDASGEAVTEKVVVEKVTRVETVAVTNKNGEKVTSKSGKAVTEKKTITEYVPASTPEKENNLNTNKTTYIINTNTRKYHKTTCSYAKNISSSNEICFTGTLSELINKYPDYEPCEHCFESSQKTTETSTTTKKIEETTKPVTTKATATTTTTTQASTTKSSQKTVADLPYRNPTNEETEIYNLINQARITEGAQALEWSPVLAAMANIRVQEFASNTDLKHSRPDGTKWSSIFKEYSIQNPGGGENLCMISGTATTAETIHTAFMNSSSHRSNLLGLSLTNCGIAVYRQIEDGMTKTYCCEIFAQDMDEQN